MVDRLLVTRCRQGSRDALRRIYEKYRDDLLILAIALSHDSGLAEDAVHDAFVAFAQNVVSFRLTGSLKAYLARCVANRVRDLMRTSRSRAKALSPEQACAAEQGLSDPSRLIACNEELRLLSSALAEAGLERSEPAHSLQRRVAVAQFGAGRVAVRAARSDCVAYSLPNAISGDRQFYGYLCQYSQGSIQVRNSENAFDLER